MIDEQFVVERVGMIEVCDATEIERQIGEVAIVGVLLDENYFAGADRFKDAICNSGLSRSSSTRNANYHAHKLDPSIDRTDNSAQQLRKRLTHTIACRHHVFMIDWLIADTC